MSKLKIKFECSEEDKVILEYNTHFCINWFNNQKAYIQDLYLKYLKTFLRDKDDFPASFKAMFQATLFDSFLK